VKTYSVMIPRFCTVFKIVEAESEEEAKQKAFEEGDPVLCLECSDNFEIGDQIGDIEVDLLDEE